MSCSDACASTTSEYQLPAALSRASIIDAHPVEHPTLLRKDRDGNPKIAVILNEEATANAVAGPSSAASSSKPDVKGKGPIGRSAGLPTEYSLKLHNTASKNLFVFGEKEEDVIETGEEGHRKRRREPRFCPSFASHYVKADTATPPGITSMLGTVHHECGLTPSISGADAAASYQRIMRERQRKAAEPKRTVKVLDVDQGTANRLASGAGLGGVKLRVSNFVVRPLARSFSAPS